MRRVQVNLYGLAAVAVVSALAPTAMAAGSSGDCCADLEERVAELEATTVRKGNRKVSLEISGHVNEAVMFWDDGEESDVYVVTNDTRRTRFRFKGSAKIDTDWEAGYLLEIGVRAARSDRVDQGGAAGDGGDDPGARLDLRHSSWFLKSKGYGTVFVGQTNSATGDITENNLSNTRVAAKNTDPEDYFAGFQLRAAGSRGEDGLSRALEWRRLVKDDFDQPGDGDRGNLVRYLSPELAGFSVSTSWGEDDYWDVALEYAGEFMGLKIAAGIGYGENADGESPAGAACIVEDAGLAGGDADCHQLGGSISFLHEPTGLFAAFGAGRFVDERIGDVARFTMANPDDKHTFYALQAGIERKWVSLGKTTAFGEYFRHEGGANDRRVPAGDAVNDPDFGDARIWRSGVAVVGAGIVQEIDAANTWLYVAYRRIEGDLTLRDDATGNLSAREIEDLDVVMTGILVEF